MDNLTAQPNVLINPSPQKQFLRQGFNTKLIFIIILVGVAVVIIIIGARILIQGIKEAPTPTPQPQSTQTPQTPQTEVPSAKLILSSLKKEYKIGETIPVEIILDTGGGSADGVDIVLKFDPNTLEASSDSISLGTIFPEYPVKKVEKDGIVRITALTSLQGEGYSGLGTFARVDFKAKASGKAKVSLGFTPGSTIDSNVVGVSQGDDMLKEVQNLEVEVK